MLIVHVNGVMDCICRGMHCKYTMPGYAENMYDTVYLQRYIYYICKYPLNYKSISVSEEYFGFMLIVHINGVMDCICRGMHCK